MRSELREINYMVSKMLLISIKPKYAELIFEGKKTAELRRVCPKINNGDLVLVYVSSPIKAVYGGFKVDSIMAENPENLWKKIGDCSGITKDEFDLYFKDAKTGFGITFSEIWSLSNPVKLDAISSKWPGFRPPQSYRYLKSGQNHIDAFLELVLN
jgi:predicted transcriptional regulator